MGAVTVGVTVVVGRVAVETVPVGGRIGSMVREPVSIEPGAVPVAVAEPVAGPVAGPVAVPDGESVAVPVYGIKEN